MRRHFLLGEGEETEGSSLVKMYSKKIDKLREADFIKFCALRRELICSGFEAWVEELTGSLSIDDRIEPEWPFWSTSDQYNIRNLHYPDKIEDALISMIRGGAKADYSVKDGEEYIKFRFQGTRGKDEENFTMHLYRDKIKIEEPPKMPERVQ
ncbi:MAG: hypothetical protein QME78_12645 [Thermodesulfobacteriota bacterium]|nr:hypothetical protein [Thermodesulfobacteriota bacterium]